MAIAELWGLLLDDPPEWHQLRPGADKAAITTLEAQLKVRLPLSYARFLRKTNGAILFGEDKILGIGGDLDLPTYLAQLHSNEPVLPDTLLPFSPTDEGVDCFLLSHGQSDQEYPIVTWLFTGEASEVLCESFDEWLFAITEGRREERLHPGQLDDDGLAPPPDEDDEEDA